jgi:transposase
VAGVAIERSDGPLVEAMLEADLRVVVVTPQQVKSLRSRYRASGAKSDPADAYLLADVLRTDATAWPRSPQTASRPRSCGRCRAPART